MAGLRVGRFVPRAARSRALAALATLEPWAPATFECPIRTFSGSERTLLVTAALLYLERELNGILLVARDVTEERRTAARAAHADKLRALGRLAAGVAHDFNDVLAAILGNTQLLRRHARDEEVGRRLSDIEAAALDGAATVRRIQEFARTRGNEPYEALDLVSLVEGAVEFTRVRWENDARARGVEYEVSVSLVGEPPTVFGDASDLREVFVNIMFNAFDAMPSGGALRVTCETAERDAVVRFVDTGLGIDRQHLPLVFEPFYTTKGATGAGLGLAVAYGIVTRHGGRIEASTEASHGATFTVTLPLAEIPSANESSDTVPVPAMKLLVIDDEESVRRVLAELLNAQGHEVDVASDGRAGLDYLERHRVDAVFTDLSMPGMDGWEVARRIREAHPVTKIVLITGFAGALEEQDVGSLVDAVVSKPFLYATLARTLRELTRPTRSR
jgi:signal transduction histidine kinase/CheY-like chemotaxis protein